MLRFSLVLMLAVGMVLVPADASARINYKFWQRSKAKTEAPARTAKVQTKQLARVERDVQRLESILVSVKTSAKVSAKSWKSVTGEADMLANRIYANVKSATAEKKAVRVAEELRTHVQRMKKEAEQGDYRETRRHAERALGAATQLDEWAG